MKIISPNNDGPIHLCTMTGTGYDTTTDRDIASEWALLVNISSCMKNIRRSPPDTDTSNLICTNKKMKDLMWLRKNISTIDSDSMQ